MTKNTLTVEITFDELVSIKNIVDKQLFNKNYAWRAGDRDIEHLAQLVTRCETELGKRVLH